jgi:hypothetical protein
MLCAWDYLPRAQSLLLSVSICDTCSDSCSDTGSDTCSDTGSNTGAGDNDDTPVGRMQVILCAELGQLVVQMFMGLLYRVSAMHSNNHQQHDSLSNGDHHHHYSCSNPIYLQAFVREKREDETLE